MIKVYNYEGSNRQGMSFKNLHLLPLYYFFPEDIIKAHPKDFQSIPRNPQNILRDKNVLDYVESMAFAVTATFDDTDKRILELRMEGRTYEEIAKEVGFKMPSAVQKRITKFGATYQKHTETDIGYD